LYEAIDLFYCSSTTSLHSDVCSHSNAFEIVNWFDSGGTSLQVFQTSVDTLGLVSLREVRNGHIYIANNSRLCYASSVNWPEMRMSTSQKILIQHNRNHSQCGRFWTVVFLSLDWHVLLQNAGAICSDIAYA